jgi:hypothetical protein
MGSDWQTRSMTTVLTWEPRRVRVLLTKAFACIVVACLFGLLAQALLGAALVPSAYLHGTTAGTGGTWGRSVLGVLGRGSALVAVAAAVGFSVASIGPVRCPRRSRARPVCGRGALPAERSRPQRRAAQ